MVNGPLALLYKVHLEVHWCSPINDPAEPHMNLKLQTIILPLALDLALLLQGLKGMSVACN